MAAWGPLMEGSCAVRRGRTATPRARHMGSRPVSQPRSRNRPAGRTTKTPSPRWGGRFLILHGPGIYSRPGAGTGQIFAVVPGAMLIASVVLLRQIDTDTTWPSFVTAVEAVPPVTLPVATTSPVFGTVAHFVPAAT